MEERPIKNNIYLELAELEKEVAQQRIPYWQSIGEYLFDSNDLINKWNMFVEENCTKAPIDDIVQILTVIKAGAPTKSIAQIINNNPKGSVILDNYMGMFVHPEILFEIKYNLQNNNYKK